MKPCRNLVSNFTTIEASVSKPLLLASVIALALCAPIIADAAADIKGGNVETTPEVVYADSRPAAKYRMEAQDAGVVLRYGASSVVIASPGMIIKSGNEYMMFVSARGSSAKTKRRPYDHICIARTKDLNDKWTSDPKPMLSWNETCENASLYFEPANQTWCLFCNHIWLSGSDQSRVCGHGINSSRN